MSAAPEVHQCPAPGCQSQISTRFYVCPRDWRLIPPALKARILRAYNPRHPEEASDELQAAANEAFEIIAKARPAARPRPDPQPLVVDFMDEEPLPPLYGEIYEKSRTREKREAHPTREHIVAHICLHAGRGLDGAFREEMLEISALAALSVRAQDETVEPIRAFHAERARQDTEFGANVDDELSPRDWLARIIKHAGRSLDRDPIRQMIIVGSLAAAAIESYDRNTERGVSIYSLHH